MSFLELIASSPSHYLNIHAQLIRRTRDLNFGQSHNQCLYFVSASSEGSGETAEPRLSIRLSHMHLVPN